MILKLYLIHMFTIAQCQLIILATLFPPPPPPDKYKIYPNALCIITVPKVPSEAHLI